MKKSENIVRRELEADGWTVLRNGWPDFLAIKGARAKFVEVKTNSTPFSPEQKAMFRALWKHTKLGYETRRLKDEEWDR